ncbi:WD40/YVTN/BNR-like repeat-containing protein [Paenibacillus tuaregi]|uniref:WD40/YVTN/BNR-like repeat-containing protein n=1 Tax=Paenibacillus tuaregi TaxID=1816681 RepID=UPI000838A23C|nr:hypothetical protein [Paenibacillus tuaregi]
MMNNNSWIRIMLTLAVTVSVAGCSGQSASDSKGQAQQQTAAPNSSTSAQNNGTRGGQVSGETQLPADAGKTDGAKTDGAKNVKSTRAQIQARLAGFKLIDNKTLFAWGSASKGSLRIYRSEDGGKNWTDISPSPSISAEGNDRDIFVAADKQHLLLFPSSEKNGFRGVMYSSDGGNTWKKGAALKEMMAGETAFISGTHGYLLTETDAAMGHSGKVFYKTTDGGATWLKVMDNASTSLGAEEEAKRGLLPQYGFTGYGVSFRDGKHGWVPLQSREGVPHLARTRDGGVTWKLVDLSKAADWEGGNPQITSAPSFFGKDRKVGWMPVQVNKDNKIDIGGFRTTDGGESWSYISFEPGIPSTERPGVPVFVSAQMGWFWNGAQLLHTADGAKSWQNIKVNSVLTDTLASMPELRTMQFTDSIHGWILAASADNLHSRLLKTEDGGRTWAVV